MWIEISSTSFHFHWLIVTPFAGVWIEIRLLHRSIHQEEVTPFAGVWIEIIVRFPLMK